MMVRYPYVWQDVDRHGNVRIYFCRKGRSKVRIRATPGTPDFEAAYHQALAGSDARAEVANDDIRARPKPGTWRWLCVQYWSSVDFAQLDTSTQRVRRRILESTLAEPIAPGAMETFADFPISRMTAKAVRVLRDRKAELPDAANNRLKTVRRVFAWGAENDHVASNPARDVSLLRYSSRGHHAWAIEEVAQYERRHPIGTRARLALALLLYTGTRRSDVVLLGRQHVRNGWLKFTQHKNRNRHPVTTEIPILAPLREVIDASPTGELTFLMTGQAGRAFSAAGFGNWFRDRCNEAGLRHCSAHGLRKAGATIAAENGATVHELMSIFGWLTIKEAERYTRSVERRKLAESATPLLLGNRTMVQKSKD
jgi:site-specific recombinase XerD